jgi:hypothetical protein
MSARLGMRICFWRRDYKRERHMLLVAAACWSLCIGSGEAIDNVEQLLLPAGQIAAGLNRLGGDLNVLDHACSLTDAGPRRPARPRPRGQDRSV